MEIIADEKIFDDFKNIEIKAIRLDSFKNAKSDEDIANMLTELAAFYKITSQQILRNEKLQMWQKYHKIVHMKEFPKQILHSHVEKLMDEIQLGKKIQKNVLEDIISFFSLKYLLPVIAFDIEKLEKVSTAGLVFESDQNHGLVIRMNQIKLMTSLGYFSNPDYCVDEGTKSALLFIFKLDFVDADEVRTMTDDMLGMLKVASENCSEKISQLDNDHKKIML